MEPRDLTPEEEKPLYEKKDDLGEGMTLITSVFRDEQCATFRLYGPRGGLKGIITVPRRTLANSLFAITQQIDLFKFPEEYNDTNF